MSYQERREVISNGASKAITAVDWNQAQANQKVITQTTDDAYVSPLETAFLPPATTYKSVAAYTNEVPIDKINPIYLIGGLVLAWKLLRR